MNKNLCHELIGGHPEWPLCGSLHLMRSSTMSPLRDDFTTCTKAYKRALHFVHFFAGQLRLGVGSKQWQRTTTRHLTAGKPISRDLTGVALRKTWAALAFLKHRWGAGKCSSTLLIFHANYSHCEYSVRIIFNPKCSRVCRVPKGSESEYSEYDSY